MYNVLYFKSTSSSPVKTASHEEDDVVPEMDVAKYRKKPALLVKKPPHPRKLRSEEPEPLQPRRERRSISESVEPPEPKTEV